MTMPVKDLPPELQAKAILELNEVPERIEEDLKHIKEWLAKQPHLSVKTDDQFLVSFLRGCKFSLQRTKDKLDQYYSMRTTLPEFFENRDPFLPEIQEFLNSGYFVPLPESTDPTEPRILLCRWKCCNPDTMLIIDMIKVYMMYLDFLLKDDRSVIAGVITIGDFGDMSLKYVMQVTPSITLKFLKCLEDYCPLSPKGLHFPSTPSAIETVYNFVKPYLSEKIQKRVFVYSEENNHKLFDIIPKAILPSEYGGDAGSSADLAELFKNQLESHREWFLEEEKYHSNESLRPVTSEGYCEDFGIVGSFRKLDID